MLSCVVWGYGLYGGSFYAHSVELCRVSMWWPLPCAAVQRRPVPVDVAVFGGIAILGIWGYTILVRWGRGSRLYNTTGESIWNKHSSLWTEGSITRPGGYTWMTKTVSTFYYSWLCRRLRLCRAYGWLRTDWRRARSIWVRERYGWDFFCVVLMGPFIWVWSDLYIGSWKVREQWMMGTRRYWQIHLPPQKPNVPLSEPSRPSKSEGSYQFNMGTLLSEDGSVFKVALYMLLYTTIGSAPSFSKQVNHK